VWLDDGGFRGVKVSVYNPACVCVCVCVSVCVCVCVCVFELSVRDLSGILINLVNELPVEFCICVFGRFPIRRRDG